MHKLLIKPVWQLRESEDEQLLTRLIPLLGAIHETGSVARASAKGGHSYRHGWGLVQQAREAFGAPLVNCTRGRGAKLTVLGERLLWADKRIAARLSPVLESLATELEAELERASPQSRGVLRIHASHAFALTALRDFLARRHIPLELTYQGSAEALASFQQSGCDAAGFHLPKGELESDVLPIYAKWLKPDAHVVVHVVERRQGIIVAHGNPRNILSVADLVQPKLRFVNRQPGSGSRIVLERLLAREKIDGERILGYDRFEYTHAAVAAYIASGMADAGLGIETAAHQFGLGFVPLVNERYFLVLRRNSLDTPMVQRLLNVMRSKEFKAELVRLQGLDAASCGKVEEIGEAFGSFRSPARRARSKAAV
ncbi:MAG TPA: substrate-binding domain-containing protein [Usitatibacter sp.]|jgi:molybdate transport repressor ModE-like protein|nr:substrate-binding domain-containing protein [Usitatibacter sp.]